MQLISNLFYLEIETQFYSTHINTTKPRLHFFTNLTRHTLYPFSLPIFANQNKTKNDSCLHALYLFDLTHLSHTPHHIRSHLRLDYQPIRYTRQHTLFSLYVRNTTHTTSPFDSHETQRTYMK